MSEPRWYVVVLEGPASPSRLELPPGGEVALGRDGTCELVVEDPRVSRRHVRLFWREDRWHAEDLGAAFGIERNGEAWTGGPLEAGDQLRVRKVLLELRQGEAAAGGPASPASSTEAPSDAAPGGGGGSRLLHALRALLDGSREGADLYELLLDGLLAGLEGDRGCVYLPAEGGFRLAGARLPGDQRVEDLPVSQRLLERVVEAGEPLLLSSMDTELLRAEIASIAGDLRSIMAAPLETAEGTGVVYLDSVVARRRFEDGDRQLLESFARAAGDLLSGSQERRRGERLAELQRRELASSEILGSSPDIARVLEEVSQAADTDVSVLVTGESGTGKELVARALHRHSRRVDGAFVAVNCAAIPSELVESELFGHEKGAFSGAATRRLGQFELADGGTLFLDEVGELPLEVQGKLLRALQERRIRRVGGSQEVPVDFRLVCATNVHLGEAAQAGRFREDLLFRIAVFRIQVPPLRRRPEDVEVLAGHFLARAAREFRRPVEGFDEAATATLRRYSWPGNVRELRNVVEQAVIRARGATIGEAEIRPALGLVQAVADDVPPAYEGTLEEARKRFEASYIRHVLARTEANMKATAEALGVSRKTLYARCEEYGIDYKELR